MSVSGTLRITASRAAQLTAAIDDADRSTPTKMPRRVSEDVCTWLSEKIAKTVGLQCNM
jgi:hypothetical protein